MRFLIDAQLPPALARWLISAGHTAEHVSDVGLAGANDEPIRLHAAAAGAVIVTKDEGLRRPQGASPGFSAGGVGAHRQFVEPGSAQVVRALIANDRRSLGKWRGTN